MNKRINFVFNAGPIKTFEDLVNALDITSDELTNALYLDDEDRYKTREIIKKDGRIRYVHNPNQLIRKIQRRIKNRIFCSVEWPNYIFGSIPSSEDDTNDYISCAARHCGAKSLIKLDIENFFDNITEDLVKKIFIEVMYYSEEVSNILTVLCCHDGRVPQGGITSSYLASLALFSIEKDIYLRLQSKKLVYTRYVDDITVSSKSVNYNFELITKILENSLSDLDLPLNKDKSKVFKFGLEPLKVHNIRLDFKEPRYDQSEVKKIKDMVRRLEKLVKEPNYRTHYFYRQDFNSCMGFLNKLGRVNHPSYEKHKKRLMIIKPLPNKADILYIKDALRVLGGMNLSSKNSFVYQKRFFKIQNRISFLKSHPKKIFEKEAIQLNKMLQTYRIGKN